MLEVTGLARATTVRTQWAKKVILKNKRPYTEKFKKSMRYVGVKKWNLLPENFHHTCSKAAYKALVDGWIVRKSKLANSAAPNS